MPLNQRARTLAPRYGGADSAQQARPPQPVSTVEAHCALRREGRFPKLLHRLAHDFPKRRAIGNAACAKYFPDLIERPATRPPRGAPAPRSSAIHRRADPVDPHRLGPMRAKKFTNFARRILPSHAWYTTGGGLTGILYWVVTINSVLWIVTIVPNAQDLPHAWAIVSAAVAIALSRICERGPQFSLRRSCKVHHPVYACIGVGTQKVLSL